MNRRQILAGLLLSSFGGLAACTRHTDKIVRLIGEDSSNLQAIARYLESVHTELTVTTQVERADFVTASNKALTAFTQHSGNYDLVLGYNFDLPRYAGNRYVYDIQELKGLAGSDLSFDFESDLLPNVWRELGYYGTGPGNQARPIAYPFAANTMVLVYSQQVFNHPAIAQAYRSRFSRAFTPPTTWEEFAEVAQLVSGANQGFDGVVLQGAEGGWLYYEWMNFLFGMGGRTMDKANGWQSDVHTPLTLRTMEAARAAQLYVSLRSANAGDFFATDAVRQKDLMRNHKVGMAIMWTDYLPDLVQSGGFGFAPIPGPVSMIAGGSFFVNRYSDAVPEAAKVVSNLLSRPVQKRLALDGLFPPTRSALSDPQVLAKPYMPAVRASLERGVYMLEAGVDATLISEKITQALQQAWRGDITPDAVGETATRLIEAGRS